MAMAALKAGRVFVAAMLVILWCSSSSMVDAFEKEAKPNNYPNFEFHESPVQDSAQVKPHEFATSFGSQFSEESGVAELGNEYHEDKPNNYPGFKFTATPGYGEAHEESKEIAHDQFAQQHHGHGQKGRLYGESFYNARDGYVYDAHQENRGDAEFESTPTSRESFYSTDMPVYRGSDERNRYPSSYDLINARNQEKDSAPVDESSFSSSETVRFGDSKTADERGSNTVVHPGLGGSSRFYTPASDPDFAFRFAKPENSEAAPVFSQLSFDDSATHGTTSPALAKKENSLASGGHGCANMYWAEHTKEWPSFFTINTQVAQAFGLRAGDIYGTTTLLQALYDNRSDGYSQLLSHGTAALMNSYAMSNYGLRHDAVIDQFLSALSSRTTAGVQAQKFFNANHAYGPNECLN
ncbi:hypothetical protein KC19_5G009700 [Ceratodon purpureus]|uniref:Uncharacterized protein n=1 Tax=Ceratodon purpureus TaxID=3225 RepID=A0A8T0HXZ4_CERPU|nr:hypothetical protein KC19_5G009700 [Ceratodon purpureus]